VNHRAQKLALRLPDNSVSAITGVAVREQRFPNRRRTIDHRFLGDWKPPFVDHTV
jgi:hypothetical protein